jgi:hypothetical protein
MTEADLRTWMDGYTIAFNAQDSEGAAMLFTEDGTLPVGPVRRAPRGAGRDPPQMG